MRFTTKLFTAAGAVLVLASAPVAPRAHASTIPVAVMTVPSASIAATAVTVTQGAKVDISVNEHRSGAWYTNPVWIAIGIIALVLIIALLAMASRGRDTTVVK